MSRKVHITKLENEVEEKAIQVRSDSPTPLEGRIHIDRVTSDMYSHLQGDTKKLNIGVYSSDPVNSFDEAWVNDTEGKLKWRKDAVVYEMNLPDKDSISNIYTKDHFYNYLLKLENRTYKKAAVVAPSSAYDTFDNLKEGATYNELKPKTGALRNDSDSVVGVYEYEKRQTQPADHVEGVTTFESQGFKAKTITDNNDGTHSIVFNGDISPLLSVGKKFCVYEKEIEILNPYGGNNVGRRGGVKYNVPSEKIYPMLNPTTGRPDLIDVASYSYNAGNNETTVVFNDVDQDLTLGFAPIDVPEKVRFVGMVVDSVVGADGLSGTLDQLQIDEINAVQERPEAASQGVITHDILNVLRSDQRYEQMNDIYWSCSPNKKHWLMLVRFGQLSDTDHWRMWYSNDGFSSLQYVDDVFVHADIQNSGPAARTTQYFKNDNEGHVLNTQAIHVNDDGRFVFNLLQWDTDYARWNTSIHFGSMTDDNFILRQPASSPGGPYGTVAFEFSGTHSYYFAGSAMEWDSNLFAISISRGDEDAWMQMWYLDFDQYLPVNSGAIQYYYLGVDYRQHHYPNIMFWKEFEGQMMLFNAQRHGNDHYYAFKIRRSKVLELFRDSQNHTVARRGGLGDLSNPADTLYLAFCGAGDYEGGTRSQHSSYMHEIAAGTEVIHWAFSQDDVLMCQGSDNVNNYMFASYTDFERTSAGLEAQNTITFDQTPDSLGEHTLFRYDYDIEPVFGSYAIDFVGDINSYSGKTMPAVTANDGTSNPNDTNFWIENDFVTTIPFLSEGEITVTGSYAQQFHTFEFKHTPENLDPTLAVGVSLKGYSTTTPAVIDDQFDNITPPSAGPEQLTNPTFDVDISSWTDGSSGTGTISHVASYGGSLSVNSGGNYSTNRADALSETVSLSSGIQYTLFVDVEEVNIAGTLGMYIIDANTSAILSQNSASGAGSYFVNYTPSSPTDIKIRFGTDGTPTAGSCIISDASLKPTTVELNGWYKTGNAAYINTGIVELVDPLNDGNGALRIKDTSTAVSSYLNAMKDVTVESGVEYILEFTLRKFIVENADANGILGWWGYQSSPLNVNGHHTARVLDISNTNWEAGKTYRYLLPTTTATDGRLGFGFAGGDSQASDIMIDNIKLIKAQDVVATLSVIQAGALPTGGDIDLTVEYWKRNASAIQAIVTSGQTGSIPAGSTNIAIQNKINAVASSGTFSDERMEHSYSKYISRCNNRVIFEQVDLKRWNFDQRGITNEEFATNEFFNIELKVTKDINYDLRLEIYDPINNVVAWIYNGIFNTGEYTIPVDYTKLGRNCVLRATSFTENNSDYKHAKFRYDYAFNNLFHGGVTVTGDWTNGFTIDSVVVRDLRFSTFSNNLVNGIQPVVETHTITLKGSSPVYLKYDNNPISNLTGDNSLFWNNGLVSADGQSYFMRDLYVTSSYVSGSNVSSHAQEYRNHNAVNDGYSFLMAHDGRMLENAADTSHAEIIKIPDYREFHGKQLVQALGTRTDLLLQGQATPRVNGATKLAQKLAVPDLGYSSLKFPVRTLELGIRRAYGGGIPKGHGYKDVYVTVKIVGVAAGFPDESNVLGTSLTKIPLNQVPSRDDSVTISSKRLPFIFNNLELTPAQDVFILVELEGLDLEAYNDDGLLISLDCNSNASGTAFGSISNVWSSMPYDIWYWFFDYYRIMPWLTHVSGPNEYTSWHSRLIAGTLTSSVSHSTLGQIGSSDSKQFIGTYQQWGYAQKDNEAAYSAYAGGARTWGFEVDNENIASMNHPPIIKDPEILGVEDQSTVDPNLVMAHASGYTPDGYKGIELDQAGVPSFWFNTGGETGDLETSDDYVYDRNAHYGGYEITYEVDGLSRYVKYSGLTYGIKDDDSFYYGRCIQHAGYRRYINNHAGTDMNPWQDDFVWEMEIQPDDFDIDDQGNRNIMLFGSYLMFYVSLLNDTNTGNTPRYHIAAYNTYEEAGNARGWVTVENVSTQYHRLRISRNQYDGVKFFRNFTKDNEGAWEEMTLDTGGVFHTPLEGAAGFQFGRYDYTRTYFSIGGWTENTSHQYYGKIGYFKMAVGGDTFAYPALEGVFNGTQPEIIGVRNMGEHMIGYQSISSGQASVRDRTKAQAVILRHSSHEPARVNTPELILKFDQEVTGVGRTKTVRHTLRREDFEDPAKVNGYILDFYKK